MANCTGSERSRPRLARIAAICSELAASPARIAAGSPGVSRSMRKTSTATISSTGIVANNRLTINPIIKKAPYGALWVRFVKLILLHIPVRVAAADHQAGDVLAHRIRIDVLAERRVRADLEGAHLDLLGDRFALGVVGLARELVAQLLDLLVAGPAEPGFLAGRAERGVGERAPHVGREPGREEDVPAALRRRLLLRASRHNGVPVHCLQINLEAGLPQQLGGDVGKLLDCRQVGRLE